MPQVYPGNAVWRPHDTAGGIAYGLQRAREIQEGVEERARQERRLALAEQSQRLEIEELERRRDQERAAQEFGTLQAQLGPERARAIASGQAPMVGELNQAEERIFARLGPEDQRFWLEQRRAERQMQEELATVQQMARSVRAMAEEVPELQVFADAIGQGDPDQALEMWQQAQETYREFLSQREVSSALKMLGSMLDAGAGDTANGEQIRGLMTDVARGRVDPGTAKQMATVLSPEFAKTLNSLGIPPDVMRVIQTTAMQAMSAARLMGQWMQQPQQPQQPPPGQMAQGPPMGGQFPELTQPGPGGGADNPFDPFGVGQVDAKERKSFDQLRGEHARLMRKVEDGMMEPKAAQARFKQLAEKAGMSVERFAELLQTMPPERAFTSGGWK